MNYINFQKKLLGIVNNPKKLKTFMWEYDNGYYYITVTGKEVFRLPCCYLYINLGLIKNASSGLIATFNECVRLSKYEAKVSNDPEIRYINDKEIVKLFDDFNLWVDVKRIAEFGTWKELTGCCHFRVSETNNGFIIFNEADEPIGLLLAFRRRNDEDCD